MKVAVQNETVKKNINLFTKVIERHSKRQKGDLLQSQPFHGFVHRTTGEIYFAEKLEDPEQKWMAISFVLGQEGDFIVLGINEQQFAVGDLFPSAYQAMTETVKILNLVLQHLQNRFDSEQLFRELENLKMEPSRDIVHDAWHQLDREEAELLLEKKHPGTYFFRKDEYAALLEDQLIEQLNFPVKCFTLTYLDKKRKVVDRTVVKKDVEWLFYNDDPSLEGPLHQDLRALLNSLQDDLTLPLLEE